jgi:hypothetical protein
VKEQCWCIEQEHETEEQQTEFDEVHPQRIVPQDIQKVEIFGVLFGLLVLMVLPIHYFNLVQSYSVV